MRQLSVLYLLVLQTACSPQVTAWRFDRMSSAAQAMSSYDQAGGTFKALPLVHPEVLPTLTSEDRTDIIVGITSAPSRFGVTSLGIIYRDDRLLYSMIPTSTCAVALSTAMRRARVMDDWDHPWNPRSTGECLGTIMILECGTLAEVYLRSILEDREKVLVATFRGDVGDLRRCDYAYWHILQARGRQTSMPYEVAARDKVIYNLIRELAEAASKYSNN